MPAPGVASSTPTGCFKLQPRSPVLPSSTFSPRYVTPPCAQPMHPPPPPSLPRDRTCLLGPTLTKRDTQFSPPTSTQSCVIFRTVCGPGTGDVQERRQRKKGMGYWLVQHQDMLQDNQHQSQARLQVGIDSISWASGGLVSPPRPAGAGPFQAALARGLSTHAESHSNN